MWVCAFHGSGSGLEINFFGMGRTIGNTGADYKSPGRNSLVYKLYT